MKLRIRLSRDVLLISIVFVLVFIHLFNCKLEPQLARGRSLLLETDYGREHGSVSQEQTISDPAFPPKCRIRDHHTIRYQLPENHCLRKQLQWPKLNACSLSYATRCPDAIWFAEQYEASHILKSNDSDQIGSVKSAPESKVPLAIHVGCNKAMDAVRTLRLISGDSQYSRALWRDTLYRGQKVVPGACGQDEDEDPPIQLMTEHTRVNGLSHPESRNAIVHCIEAMPTTAASLLNTSLQLGWHKNLIVTNSAMANRDGTTLFPNVEDTIGAEVYGLSDCDSNKTKHLCKEVPVTRLDTFTAKHVSNDTYIEFLSIDAEGYDFDILSGGPETLKRSKYLEFEYHWVGTWQNYNLSTAIDMLKDLGFVCYWAGAFGHVWRITDCWMDYYNIHSWSNVACVNLAIASTASLAARMEYLFQETLGANYGIRYNNHTAMKLLMNNTNNKQ